MLLVFGLIHIAIHQFQKLPRRQFTLPGHPVQQRVADGFVARSPTQDGDNRGREAFQCVVYQTDALASPSFLKPFGQKIFQNFAPFSRHRYSASNVSSRRVLSFRA